VIGQQKGYQLEKLKMIILKLLILVIISFIPQFDYFYSFDLSQILVSKMVLEEIEVFRAATELHPEAVYFHQVLFIFCSVYLSEFFSHLIKLKN